MNKLKITFIAAFAAILMVLPSSAEVRVGLALGQTSVETDGTQTMKDSAEKRAIDTKALADKGKARAETEASLPLMPWLSSVIPV